MLLSRKRKNPKASKTSKNIRNENSMRAIYLCPGMKTKVGIPLTSNNFLRKSENKFFKKEALSVLENVFQSSHIQDVSYQKVHFASTVSSI